MAKKYEITGIAKIMDDGTKVYRIRALKTFSNIKAGDLGGFVENESNLSQDMRCWIYDDAVVYQNATVNADSQVSNGSVVKGTAAVCDCSRVSGFAVISGNVSLYDGSAVTGFAEIGGEITISGDSLIDGYAKLASDFQLQLIDVRIAGLATITS